jgi:hypothetical protein
MLPDDNQQDDKKYDKNEVVFRPNTIADGWMIII